MIELKDMISWLTRTTIIVVIISVPLIALAYILEYRNVDIEIIPFSFFHFWGTFDTLWSKTFEALIGYAWIPLLLVLIHSLLVSYVTWNKPEANAKAEQLYLQGAHASVHAGVVEEILFRWIIFYGYIVFMVAVDNLSLWLFGISIPKLIYEWVFEWLANLCTLGFLSFTGEQFGWTVGAAMLAANGLFRDGHVYNGLWGLFISWLMGMFFFWIMFRFGLVPAIVIHFAYDFIIFTVRYIDMAMERSAGRTTHSI